jgi:CheY-like chemotaxis protein
MHQEFKILVADRNRNVRQFLRRELAGEGYQVILAGEGRELAQLLRGEDPPDLLILDPDIPSYLTKPELIKLLHVSYPALPIVIYTFLYCDINYLDFPGVATCVEKGEDIDLLKKVIAGVLNKNCPPVH